MRIYVVIPAYNEEERIKSVIRDVRKKGLPIIVVDDGSNDTTSLKLRSASTTSLKLRAASKTSNNRLITLTHRVNLGKGAAMKTGAEAAFLAGGDAVIFMDSDGQHKAEDLHYFIDALENKKFDVVFGSRNLSHGVPFERYLGNKFASVLISLLFGIYVSDLICGYRAITKKAYGKIKWESTGYGVETEMAIRTAKSGLKYCEVPVATVYYDEVKGVTILDAFNIFFDVIRWRIRL